LPSDHTLQPLTKPPLQRPSELEFGHNGLFHHAPAELRTGAELLRKVQLAQLDRSLRPPRALLRCSRHALLGASQQALAGRARLPVRRHLEAKRLPAEEVVPVVQPGLQRHPSVARADVAKVPGPCRVPALVAEQRGEGMKVPSREASRGECRRRGRRSRRWLVGLQDFVQVLQEARGRCP